MCNLSFTSEMALMDCGHCENCLLVSESFQQVVKVAQKLEITVQLVIGQRFHSSTMEDVDRVPPYLALLSDVSGSRKHTRRTAR